MWPEIFEWVSTITAVICCAFAVKLTDDYLDEEQDKKAGRLNYAAYLGKGTMVYAMVLLSIGASLSTAISLSLFLASYIVGMFNDIHSQFPSGLTGWQESILVLLISITLFGWRLAVVSTIFITAVQLIDDCIDLQIDRMTGQRNLACHYGMPECLLLSLLCFLVCWQLGERIFLLLLIGTALSYAAMLKHGWWNRA